MKKLLLLSGLLIGAFSFKATAQNCTNDFLGTKALYKDPHVKYSPVHVGYQPVFINYVGRHGARHLTKDVNTSYSYKMLVSADSVHTLTAQGQELKQMVMALDRVEKGNVKSISAEGVNELKAIGERIYTQNKNVFAGQSHFNVTVTKEIRTTQSANAFLSGLKSKLKDSAVMKMYTDDVNLRFFDASPVYKQFEQNGPWSKQSEELEKAVHLATIDDAFTARIFAHTLLSADDKKQFTNDIFGFVTIAYSVMEEAKKIGVQPSAINFKQFFTCDEIIALSKIDIADDYYKKGPGIDNNGIQVRIAAPLLANFIKTSDEFIKNGGVNAQLRFAHAETIIPIAALMEISTANKASKDINTIGKLWQSALVAPLSSNVQWIFYKKQGSNKYLVKILLNEKEAHITGINNNGSVYYNWDTLRAFYMKKLQQLNVGLDDDMKAYLANVK